MRIKIPDDDIDFDLCYEEDYRRAEKDCKYTIDDFMPKIRSSENKSNDNESI